MMLTPELMAEIEASVDDIKDAAKELGIELTNEQVSQLLSERVDLLESVVNWGIDDTETKGELANGIVRTFFSIDHWPTYGDGTEGWNDFCRKIHEAAASGTVKVNLERFRLTENQTCVNVESQLEQP